MDCGPGGLSTDSVGWWARCTGWGFDGERTWRTSGVAALVGEWLDRLLSELLTELEGVGPVGEMVPSRPGPWAAPPFFLPNRKLMAGR